MNAPGRMTTARAYFGFAALAMILAISILALVAPPDGVERAELLQFVGRFHPLSVHLPIAVLFLVALFEVAGRYRPFAHLRDSVEFLLCVAICGAIFAALLGWCLARGGGYSGKLVTQHMWGAVLVSCATWICWFLRDRISEPLYFRSYFSAIAVTLVLVFFTGYRGGQVSQGENHLTQFMPAPLRAIAGLSAPSENTATSHADPETFFGGRIQPLFEARCVACHGQTKHKAGLRLDTFESVMKGSKHGPVIKPGDLKGSELFRRITLPPTDDDFMPAEHKRPLSSDEVRLVELWISSGASATQPVDAVNAPATAGQTIAAEIELEEMDPAAVARARAAAAPAVAALQQRLPNVVAYQSRTSADIVVTASWLGSKFGDAELSALAPIGDRIVEADFSNTAITDRSASALAAMKNLRQLRLMHTNVTDATVNALGSLKQLESLNVFDTRITAASLPAIVGLKKLRRIYAGQTKIAAAQEIPASIKDKLVF